VAGRELENIDWSQPWFAATAQAGERLAGTDGALCDRLNRLLGVHADAAPANAAAADAGLPHTESRRALRFTPQSDLPADLAYETHIYETGHVPTRDNLHDLFNGLAWLAFPRIKARLNAIQAQALKSQGAGAPAGAAGRGALRDAITILDENGLVLACSNDGLAQALRRFEWRTLFVERRTSMLMQTEPWVVGHALMEKLVNPYKSITAHTLIVPVDESYFRATQTQRRETIDRLVSDWLENWMFLTPRDLAPLPVLGLPGWWPANTQAAFYDDTDVFRPGRTRQK
jgi:hypothetical protein